MFQSSRSLLPPELTDMVIDHLQNEKAALSRTALVNKSWLIRSRIHLFRVIAVTAEFTRFAAFLHERKHLRPCIQRLTLQGDVSADDDIADTASLEPIVLASILAQLPHLQHLCLLDVSFRMTTPMLLLPSALFKIDEVTLINVGSCEDTTNDVLHTLGLFSEIRSLNILAVVQCLDDNDTQARTENLHIPQSLSVSSLKIEDVPYELYTQIFRRTDSVHTLKNIEMECTDLSDAEALAELLQDASASVESLSLNLTQCFMATLGSEDDSEALSILSSRAVCEALGSGISACTKLRSLEIGVSLDHMGEQEAWKTISGILHSASASSVQRLDIAIACDDYVEPLTELELDWEPLSGALGRFSNLKSVTVGHVPGTSWVFSEEEQGVVRSHLPDLVKRGVLRTTWHC